METRANYVAVGAFVVILLVAAAGVMLWLIGSQFAVKVGYFHISFEGSVSGLTKDSTVRYNGVPVGKVSDIAIDKVESEESKLGARRLERKREPVNARGHLGLSDV